GFAIHGVKGAVTKPPSCAPIFIKPETEPEEGPAISAVTDQKELCARYNAPAPPAKTMLARRALSTSEPRARKMAAIMMTTAAKMQRPTRGPRQRVKRSLINPPIAQPAAIAMK